MLAFFIFIVGWWFVSVVGSIALTKEELTAKDAPMFITGGIVIFPIVVGLTICEKRIEYSERKKREPKIIK